ACPNEVDLESGKDLLNFCRMSDSQLVGAMRALAGCQNKAKPEILARATITEILALPAASPDVDGEPRDYRDKVVYYAGSLPTSNIRYRATGEVIAEPKRQRASLIISKLERLDSAADRFEMTPEIRERLAIFRPRVPDGAIQVQEAAKHVNALVVDITKNTTKIYGSHRKRMLFGTLLTLHSPPESPWAGKLIKC